MSKILHKITPVLLLLCTPSCNVVGEVAKVAYVVEKMKISKDEIYGRIGTKLTIEKTSSSETPKRYYLDIYKVGVTFFSETKTAVARLVISFDLDLEEPEFLLPSIWIKDNKFSQDKIYSTSVSKRWIVREDRLSIPCVMARGKNGETFALLKFSPTYDSSAGMDEDEKEEIIYKDSTDISGFGFDYGNKKLILTFPFEEYPVVYRRKIFTQMTQKGKKAFTFIEKGKDKSLEFFIILGKTDSFSSAVEAIWKTAYDILVGENTLEIDDILKEKVKKALALYFRNYFHQDKISGFFPFVDTYEGKITLMFLEAGFTGMVLMNARNSIELGRDLGDQELVKMGEQVIDSWIDFGTKNGIFIDCWDVSRSSICDLPPIFFRDSFFTRRAFESLLALYMAFSAEEKRGISRERWKKAFVDGARNLLMFQRSDGSFARRYSFDGGVEDSSPAGTLFAVPVFVKAFELTGDQIFLSSAEKAGEIIVRFSDNFEYYGATIDANSEDKEAAMWALYSCYLLFKSTKNEKYRRCVKNSLYASLSWFFLWDVPFSQDQLFGKIKLRTKGLGAVSVENNHLDVYSFFFVKILKEIAKIQEDEHDRKRLENMAEMIFHSILSVVPVEGDSKGVKLGIVPEVIQQTWWDYGLYGKGSYAPLSAIGWTVASILSTIYADEF